MPELVELVDDAQLLQLWNGMLNGAQVKGSNGASDRAALTRALGLPFYQTGKAAQAGGRSPEGFARRLEGAIARAEASRGQDGVTDDDADQLDGAEWQASEGEAHKLPDHVRVEEGEEAPPPTRSSRDHPAGDDEDSLAGE